MKQWVQQLWTATEIGSALVWHRWISLLVQAVISTTSIQCQNVLYVCNLSVLPAFSQSSYHLCLFGLFFLHFFVVCAFIPHLSTHLFFLRSLPNPLHCFLACVHFIWLHFPQFLTNPMPSFLKTLLSLCNSSVPQGTKSPGKRKADWAIQSGWQPGTIFASMSPL